MELSACKSVLDESFQQALRLYAADIDRHLAALFRSNADPLQVRAALGNALPSEHIQVRIRYCKAHPSPLITSFSHNLLVLPLGRAQAALSAYEITDKNTLVLRTRQEANAGIILQIDERVGFFALDRTHAGVFIEAFDKSRRKLEHRFSREPARHVATVFADAKDAHLKYASKILSMFPTEAARSALLKLIQHEAEEVRWMAAKAYCSIAEGSNCLRLLKRLSMQDPSPAIRNAAQATIKKLGAAHDFHSARD